MRVSLLYLMLHFHDMILLHRYVLILCHFLLIVCLYVLILDYIMILDIKCVDDSLNYKTLTLYMPIVYLSADTSLYGEM